MKPSFILHKDSLCVLEDLTNEQRGELFYAIYCYQIGKELELSPITKIAFSQFRNQFVRDEEKFKKTVEARKQAGSKGGKQRVANQANASTTKQTKANQAVSDSDSDSVSVKDNIFTFSLKTSRLLSSTSREYQTNLQEYVINSGKQMNYEDFYNQCEMKPYKYKNFKMAYDSWNKKDKQQPKSFKQQDAQKTEDALDAFLNAREQGFDLRNVNSETVQEVHGFKVIEDNNIPTNEIHIVDENGVVQEVEVIEG